MKKHVFGLLVFGFIVSAAAIVYAVFNVSEIVSVSIPKYASAEKTDCKFNREIDQPKIVSLNVIQAVYSVKTKKISWQGTLPDKKTLTYFHFWSVDEKGLKFIDSISANKVLRGDRLTDSDGKQLNLDKISSSANLYLVPDNFKQSSSNEIEHHPKFDKEKAIPVTIDYDE